MGAARCIRLLTPHPRRLTTNLLPLLTTTPAYLPFSLPTLPALRFSPIPSSRPVITRRTKYSIHTSTRYLSRVATSQSGTYKLFCQLDGPNGVPFSVSIDPNATVDELKKYIKQEMANDLKHVDASKLLLWKVKASTRQKIEVPDEEPLNPTWSISDYWSDGPVPKHIHVLIRTPATLKRGRDQELKVPQKFPKFLDATSISDTSIFQTIPEKSGAEQCKLIPGLPRDLPHIRNWRTVAGTIFADKTPYIEALEKEARNYRFVFLRPRRFGKSAFLNMLCEYYDLHTADIFDDLFGPLYIGKNPTPSKNKHLILKFDLSSIDCSGSRMETSFNDYINNVLEDFLAKYRAELGDSEDINSIIYPTNANQSLRRVLSLARKYNQSLFVGVDEYDAPANNSAFAGGNTRVDKDAIEKVKDIEAYFKVNFFSVLKEGCAIPSTNDYGGMVISKYFLTGVTPAFRAGISPLNATTIVSNKASLHGICGFTENEVKAIVSHYLQKDEQDVEPILYSMRRLYNGYYFTMSSYDESNPDPALLFNPHLVFHYLSNFKSEGFVAKPEESTAVHSTTILRSISDIGEFSATDLIELIATESVQSKIKTEFGYSELLAVGKNREITWSLLFYLGILTFGPNRNLRIPNDIIKSDVLDRISTFLRTQDNISTLMPPAIRSLKAGNVERFRELLEDFLLSRTVRSLRKANEAVFHGIIEVLLFESSNCISELRLVVDGSKKPKEGRFGWVDIFIPRSAIATASKQTCVLLELKNATLEGLWSGATGRVPDSESDSESESGPDYKDLENLHQTLRNESEDSLLARKYMYYSKKKGMWVSATLGSIMENGLQQLQRYMKTITFGEVQSYKDSGVLDPRVSINIGLDNLRGYVVMAIGGARVLIRSVDAVKTKHKYAEALRF